MIRSIRGTKVTGEDRAALHKEMLYRITDFESLVAELGDSRQPITKEDVLDIKKAIAILKALPAVRPMPTGDYIGAHGAETILKRIASKSDGMVALPYWLAVWHIALMRLTRSVTNWLH
jgi:hypothetical protein